ncbi:MAG: hypothetical protein AAGB97_08935 [Dehalococcoidia bacterium]
MVGELDSVVLIHDIVDYGLKPGDIEVLEMAQELILEEIEGRERRADAYVALKVLSGIKYPLEVLDKVLTRRDIMIESPVYQQIRLKR